MDTPLPTTPLEQLTLWAGRDYHVELSHHGRGWVCMISTDDVMKPYTSNEDKTHLRACSPACTTPEEAIESLLKVVQP